LFLATHRELARLPGVSVTATVVGRALAPERARQGWSPEAVDDVAPISLEGDDWWRRGLAVLKEHPDSLHLFNTMWTDPRFLPLIVAAAARGRRIGLLTEPYSDTVHGYFTEQSTLMGRFLRALKPPIYRTAGLALGGRRGPILAISPKAVAQF